MQRELPIALVPMVMVVMNLVYALSAYPAGVLSDRRGRGGLLTVIDYRRIRPAPHGAMAARSMKGIAVNTRIQLLDVDRPGEIFEANLEEATPTRLAPSVPNTIVRF